MRTFARIMARRGVEESRESRRPRLAESGGGAQDLDRGHEPTDLATGVIAKDGLARRLKPVAFPLGEEPEMVEQGERGRGERPPTTVAALQHHSQALAGNADAFESFRSPLGEQPAATRLHELGAEP